MIENYIITAYESPDIDGVACGFAYEELLINLGKKVKFFIYGSIQEEVKIIHKKFNFELPQITNIEFEDTKFIIVDASDINGLSKKIKPFNVFEVIDHRKNYTESDFPNAKFEISFVGAAATIISEKFYESKISISKKNATLLYYAIVSNTINFKANVTTERDIIQANFLKNIIGNNSNYVDEILKEKSKKIIITKESLIDFHYADFNFSNIKIGIVQLEIANVQDFLDLYQDKLLIVINEIIIFKKLDYGFITIIDLIKGKNTFIAPNIHNQKLLSGLLQIDFKHSICFYDKIIMRKEIVPLLKEYFQRIAK